VNEGVEHKNKLGLLGALARIVRELCNVCRDCPLSARAVGAEEKRSRTGSCSLLQPKTKRRFSGVVDTPPNRKMNMESATVLDSSQVLHVPAAFSSSQHVNANLCAQRLGGLLRGAICVQVCVDRVEGSQFACIC